jgi:hypothetical protein
MWPFTKKDMHQWIRLSPEYKTTNNPLQLPDICLWSCKKCGYSLWCTMDRSPHNLVTNCQEEIVKQIMEG